MKTIDDLKEVDKAALDAKQVVGLINHRVFQRNSDATRLLVRSRETPDDPLKYTIEYVQAALSLEKKLCVMLYDEGTRDHMLQEEKSFKDINYCRSIFFKGRSSLLSSYSQRLGRTRVVAAGLLVPRSPLFGGCLFGRFENGNA